MARTSRKENPAASIIEEKRYNTALYVRLSSEDDRKVESESVEKQVEFLNDYIRKNPALKLIDTYIDRSITGTKFNRPQFNRMIADIKAGRINCVVVKDLSRLGRNYLEAGDYIEKIFPFFGVRFIAVTDNYDSLTSTPADDGLIVPLKNLINEAYAKDISRKRASACESKFKAGIYTATMAPYGYTRVEGDTSALAVDVTVRPIVVKIFTDYANGKSMIGIAKELNFEGVPSPTQYYFQTGVRQSTTNTDSRWMIKTLRQMMQNPVYIGDVEMGKGRCMLYKGIKYKKMEKEDRYYVPNHHEPIISREIYEIVQKRMMESKNEYKQRNDKSPEGKNNREAILKGILYCGDCRHPMYMRRRTRKIKSGYGHYSYYSCSRSGIYENDPKKYINADRTEKKVADLIRNHIAKLHSISDQIRKQNQSPVAIKHRETLKKSILESEARKEKITGFMNTLYADFTDGVFSEKEYIEVKSSYAEELDRIDDALKEIRNKLSKYEESFPGSPEIADALKKYDGFETLTSDIVKTFVKRIYFYSDERMDVEFVFEGQLASLKEHLRSMEEAA